MVLYPDQHTSQQGMDYNVMTLEQKSLIRAPDPVYECSVM